MDRARESAEGGSPIWLEASKHPRRFYSGAGQYLPAPGTQLASNRIGREDTCDDTVGWASVFRESAAGKERTSPTVAEILVGRFGQGPS